MTKAGELAAMMLSLFLEILAATLRKKGLAAVMVEMVLVIGTETEIVAIEIAVQMRVMIQI